MIFRRSFQFAAASVMAAGVFNGGCSPADKAPDPPRIESRLAAEALTAAAAKDYKTSAAKLKRICQINPASIELKTLYNLEAENTVVAAAQAELDSNRVDQAASLLATAAQELGKTPRLAEAAAAIDVIRKIDFLVTESKAPADSTDLFRTLATLRTIVTADAAWTPLSPYIEARTEAARSMLQKERRRAVDSIKAELDLQIILDGPHLETLAAEASIEDPDGVGSDMEQLLGPIPKTVNTRGGGLQALAIFRAAGTSISNSGASFLTASPSDLTSMLAATTAQSLATGAPLEFDAPLLAALHIRKTPPSWLILLPFNPKSLQGVSPLASFPYYVYLKNFQQMRKPNTR